jgi:5-methylcytosine-specific restriction endonuclease McrA
MRAAKKDPLATMSRGFLDPRSFMSKDGRQFLYGEDTSVRRHEVWERCGGFCEMNGCNRIITEESMHMHHDRERSKGGDESMGNLVAACWPCHKRVHGNRNPQFRGSKNFQESLGDA